MDIKYNYLLFQGMSHSLTSATLPDLREKVGVTIEEVGRAFAIGGIGGIIGALLGSLADRLALRLSTIS